MKNTDFISACYGSHRVSFEADERRGIVAIASDLPGVITWGKNLVHAKEMIREAIELCIASQSYIF